VAQIAISDITKHDETLGKTTPYTGPVSGETDQYINLSTDDLILNTASPNVFLRTGAGDDAIQVASGRNVLDGGTGSNFLVGGTDTDTFFVDGRGEGVTWNTISGFHAGDDATIWGWQDGVSKLSWADGQGAAGFQGATLHADLHGTGSVDDSITFSGFTVAQAMHFVIQTGTVEDNSYMHIAFA
jgi:serralysin